MTARFEVSLSIEGEQSLTTEAVEMAIKHLVVRAVRMPPDKRIDWHAVHVNAVPYVPTVTR